MDSRLEERFPQVRAAYLDAAARGFPAFVRSIEDSTPLNATPYVVGLQEFLAAEHPSRKAELVNALVRALADLRNHGCETHLILIGGSFLAHGDSPKDLDCVLYYTRTTAHEVSLASWQKQQQQHDLDLRLVPFDADPVLVLKMTLFFGALYGRGRGPTPALRGLLLLDCAR